MAKAKTIPEKPIRPKETVPKKLSDDYFFGFNLDEDQKALRDAIWDENKLIVFCSAKSGSGKTTIATCTAKLMYDYDRYDGIIYIASPTQEDRLGFLPGTADEKAEPYFEPFYEACLEAGINKSTDISDGSLTSKKYDRAYIECRTHVYLRGVNFDNKIVIIDEAQNFDGPDLKKTLTRCKDTCKVVVIGHTGQCDLKDENKSGFKKFIEHFEGDDRVAVVQLSTNYRGWISSHADDLIL